MAKVINPFRFGKGIGWLAPYLVLAPALILFLVFHFVPSLATVAFSFTDITRTGYREVSFVGLENYQDFFRPAQFAEKWTAIRNSIVFAVVVVLVQNALALMFAIVLDRAWRGRAIFRALIFLPVILGITVNALIWRLMFYPFGGAVTSVLDWFSGGGGEVTRLFFADPDAAFPLIIFVQIWSYIGTSTIIFLSGLQAIPKALYEAATVDGARGWKRFWSITFPMLAQAMTVNMLLAIIGALRTFDTIYVTTNGAFETFNLAFYVFRLAFQGGTGSGTGRLGFASAVETILFVLIFGVAVIAQHLLRKREVEL